MNSSIEFLKKCDEAYYNTGEPLIPDSSYDTLKESQRASNPNDPYFKAVGAPVDGDDFPLPYILGSLNKKKCDGTTSEWIKARNIKKLSCSEKLDGVSLYIRFNDGLCVEAATRGDGYKGKLVTDKIKLICPAILASHLEVRCEAVMEPTVALQLGYKNARNAVSGILSSDSGENIEYVKLVFYHVFNMGLNTYSEHIQTLSSFYLPTPATFELNTSYESNNIEETLRVNFLNLKKNSLYDIDGLVIADDSDPVIGEDYYPDNISAFKVNAEAIDATVTDIEWSIGRTGKLAPVVLIEPVDIGGATISRATGFNAKFIEVNNIFPGARIGIQRSGDVIPYITTCYETESSNCILPEICPSCGEQLTLSKTQIDLYCLNPKCNEKAIYGIEHFLLSHGCEEITATTLRKLNIYRIEDLYDLGVASIVKVDGFGPARAVQIIFEIQKTLLTTPSNLLKSFGIPGVGDTLSKVLTNKFSFEELLSIDKDTLLGIDGIGDVLATNIVDGMNKNLYDFLLSQGLKFKDVDSDILKGKVFALTGKSEMKRNDIVKMIENHGGLVKSVSKGTDYLVTDDPNGTSSKTVKAKQLGIKTVSYSELMEMFKNV